MRTRASLLVLVSLFALSVFPQTVVQRARLGHAIEDLDTFEKRLVALDGQEIYVSNPKGGFEKLFNATSGGADHCTGIAYVPTEKSFLLIAPAATQFFVFDDKGKPLGTRPITYLGGFSPIHAEALTYLGKDTPYPDHVAFLAYNPFSTGNLVVAKRDGTAVLQVPLPPIFLDAAFGMSSAGGDHVYILSASNEIYTMDFAGQLVGSPVRVHDGFVFEGITVVEDRVYVRDYYSGKFIAFDRSLQRQPAGDLRHDFGLGLGGLNGLAWNSDRDQFLVLAAGTDVSLAPVGWAVTSSLDEARPRFYSNAHGYQRPRGLAWMPDEHKMAVAHQQVLRRILIYSADGTLLEQIDVTPIGRPTHIAWIPSTHEFYVRVVEMPATIRVLTRTGAFVRDIDVSALGPAVGAFTHTGGQLLLFAGGLLHRTDLDGNPITSYDYSGLKVLPAAISAITTGPLAGNYAIAAARNCELVVFSLP